MPETSVNADDFKESSGISSCSPKSTDVSEDHISYILRAKEYSEQLTSGKAGYMQSSLHAGFLISLINSEDGGDIYVNRLRMGYTAKDRTFHNHCSETSDCTHRTFLLLCYLLEAVAETKIIYN
jgi:hypothetical protein